jgi:hypothetical protein
VAVKWRSKELLFQFIIVMTSLSKNFPLVITQIIDDNKKNGFVFYYFWEPLVLNKVWTDRFVLVKPVLIIAFYKLPELELASAFVIQEFDHPVIVYVF